MLSQSSQGPCTSLKCWLKWQHPAPATFLVANSGHLWRKRMGRDGRDGQELANCGPPGPPGPQNSHASVNGLLPQFRRSNCFDSNMISPGEPGLVWKSATHGETPFQNHWLIRFPTEIPLNLKTGTEDEVWHTWHRNKGCKHAKIIRQQTHSKYICNSLS